MCSSDLHCQHKRQKYTNGYGCNDPSFHNPPPILLFPYLLFTWELSVLRCHFFVSTRNNIKTLYQISLAKACFLLYNIDTGEPRMQHPWRQREHPFSSDLIALIFWFSQCTRYWLRADATLSVSAVCHPCPMAGSPYACCAPSSAAPVPVQGRPPFAFLTTRTALPRLSFSTQSFYVTCFFLC